MRRPPLVGYLVAAALLGATSAIGAGCCHFDAFARHRIVMRPFPENPTEWLYDVPTDTIWAALQSLDTVSQKIVVRQPRENWSYWVRSSDMDSSLAIVVEILDNSTPRRSDTNVYCFDGRPLRHRPDLLIVTIYEKGAKALVRIRTSYLVAFGTEFFLPNWGCKTHYEPVPSATIEEYQVLLYIGAAIGDTTMPPLSKPASVPCPMP